MDTKTGYLHVIREGRNHFALDVRGQREYVDVLGKEVSIEVIEPKKQMCRGWYDLAALKPNICPSKSYVESGNICKGCKTLTGYFPAFDRVSESELSEAQREYNKAPHVVYLASFGGRSIKVGISHANRTLTRWLDQGAWCGIRLTVCQNALRARHMERAVSSEFNIPELASKSIKKKYLLHGEPVDLRWFKRMASTITQKLALDDATELTIVRQREHWSSTLELAQPILALSGRVIEVVGSFLIIESSKTRFAFDFAYIQGRFVRLSFADLGYGVTASKSNLDQPRLL